MYAAVAALRALLDLPAFPRQKLFNAVSAYDEYFRRQSAREAQVQQLRNVQARLGYARLLIAALALLAVWWAFQRHAFSPWWVLLPVAAFAGTVIYHQRVRRAQTSAERAVQFYRKGIARIEDRWSGTGRPGTQFDDSHHVYAADLDLFGKGSLFELLSTARTRMGEDTLARWLLSPAAPAAIRDRHACIADLRNRLDLREEFAVHGSESDIGVQPAALSGWAESPNELTRPWIRPVASALTVLAIATATVWSVWGIASPFLLVLLVEIGVWYALKRPVESVLSATENAFEDLQLFAALLTRLEREHFEAPALQQLLSRLRSHSAPASETIARLATTVNIAESRRNPILSILNVPLMFSVHAALATERWRREHGKVVRSWIDVLGEYEALASLATYSYEHPDDPFPEIVDEAASFEAHGLGHPLIPAAQCVRNDVSLTEKTRVLLVSGSNMSGKSTLLRTVGINTALAMAGAPVRAHRLKLTPLQVGASIRINDSLHEGSSRFYAEITRLRQLFDLQASVAARGPALLFLLDELLMGTNSRDRRIGAEGIVRALIERGAIGLISTHDLALTEIAGVHEGALRNVHFQDELVGGRMTFDFRLREGVVAKSNGIELMRSIGLEV